MLSDRQRVEAPSASTVDDSLPSPSAYEDNCVFASQAHNGLRDSMNYFLGKLRNQRLRLSTYFRETEFLPLKNPQWFHMLHNFILSQVVHSYQAEYDVELNFSVGDYVVVGKVYSFN